jgi:hypothetical protein
MKYLHMIPIAVVVVAGGISTVAIHGCTKQPGFTALDASKIVCCVAQKTSDEEAIKKACGIADDLSPYVRELIAAKADAAASAATKDGGSE